MAKAANRQVTETADLLHSAAIHFLRRAADQDRTSGMSAARLSALSVIVYAGPLTLGALATAERVRSATMSGIVNGLVGDGLATRRKHPTDQRAVLIAATTRGRRVLELARSRRLAAIADRLREMPSGDLATLRRAAAILEGAFGPPRHR
jgi:DNA-binding MarR family transcriptional regulator